MHFYNAPPTYLFYTSHSSNNPHSSKHRSWESSFHFWTSESLLLHVQKNIFHENNNTFETVPYVEHSVIFIKVVNKAQIWLFEQTFPHSIGEPETKTYTQ